MLRSLVAAALHFVPLLALPLPRSNMLLNGNAPGFEVLEYKRDAGYTKFEIAPGFPDEQLTSPLVLELQVNPTPDLLTSNISLNGQPLDITWTTDSDTKSSVVTPQQQTLFVSDRLGLSHSLLISITGTLSKTAVPSDEAEDVTQDVDLHVDSVDGIGTGFAMRITANPPTPLRLVRLSPIHVSQSFNFDQYEESFMLEKQDHHVSANEPVGYDDDAYDIEVELESLLLLEAEAGELHTAIATKKHAIAKCLKGHRDHVSLKHLLSQCDGLVCAAKVIAQRICDKVGIETLPKVGYVQVRESGSQQPMQVEDASEKSPNVTARPLASEEQDSSTRASSIHSAAIQDVRLVHPQNVLLRVLGVIATAIGLIALFGFIRRRCMSARSRVDREADREERRTARAYRRAARRAEMRRRWDAFVTAINCFKSPPEPRNEDYEEKRALILQDAFLQQDPEVAEKGGVMEAEILELRHAQQIVSDLVRVHERRYLPASVNDPPPPLVPLPYTPQARSRASTQTLPSYCSEVLPDYTSRYARTETASNSSSLRSLRSHSVATDGLSVSSPTATSESGRFTDSTPRSNSTEGSRTSRYTPTSSIVEVLPRASEDTLRTAC